MAWDILYYEDLGGIAPGLDCIEAPHWPTNVRATMLAVLDAVAAAPPPRFSGGGMWEAMHAEMGGYYEVRKQGAPNRTQYRLFCLLENADPAELKRRGLIHPAIVVITGMSKPFNTVFSDADYAKVRRMGNDHLSNFPRRVAQ